MAAPRLRMNAMMDTQLSDEDLLIQARASAISKENYQRAYKIYEWGTEFFVRGVMNYDLQNWYRAMHYLELARFFHMLTTNRDAIRMYTGHEASIFFGIMQNPAVLASLAISLSSYHGRPRTGYLNGFPRVPLSAGIVVVIAMHYIDTGCNFKQASELWKIPTIHWVIEAGLDAILKLDNIKLPTTRGEWLTSIKGFEKKHGFPNVALSLDVTPIYGMIQDRDYKCSELNAHVLKVGTVMDGTGMFKDVEFFQGSNREPEILASWPFFHRLKATEALIGLPGWPRYNRVSWPRGTVPLENYPSRIHWPLNQDGSRPRTETTAPGVIVDQRYSNVSCGLFIAPRNRWLTMHIYNQRLFRTRFFHERMFGILSQYMHLKQRPMPMDCTSANHPIRKAIRAGFMIMNERILQSNNPEHPCLSFCTAHRIITNPITIRRMIDRTPYSQPPWYDLRPRLVSDMVEAYCVECLDPYTDDNIQYLMRQMKWPTMPWNDRDVGHDAFNRELMRILQQRVNNRYAWRRGQLLGEVVELSAEQRNAIEDQQVHDVLNDEQLRAQWRAEQEHLLFIQGFLEPELNPPGYRLGHYFDEQNNQD